MISYTKWNVVYLTTHSTTMVILGQETVVGNSGRGWVGRETMKDDTFLRSTRNPWTAISRTRTTNLQIYSSARYHRANPTPPPLISYTTLWQNVFKQDAKMKAQYSWSYWRVATSRDVNNFGFDWNNLRKWNVIFMTHSTPWSYRVRKR